MKKYAVFLLALLLLLMPGCVTKQNLNQTDDNGQPQTVGSGDIAPPGSDGPSKPVDSPQKTTVINIVNKAKLDPDINLATAIEVFYEDEQYSYYFNYIISPYITVYYADGTHEGLLPALSSGRATVYDLDDFGIGYNKEQKNLVTQQGDILTVKITGGITGKDQKTVVLHGAEASRIVAVLYQFDYSGEVCKCLPEYTLELSNGESYGVHLTEGYIRYNGKQTLLTKTQIEDIATMMGKPLVAASASDISN